MIHAAAACGAAFLMAVLWFDLMFDMMALRRRTGDLPDEVLRQIGAYYRRVTTEASPMGRAVTLAMLITLGAIVAGLVWTKTPGWIGWVSLAAAAAAILLARFRTVPAAVRLGRGGDDVATRTRLVRILLADHLFSLAAIALVLGLQLSAVG
jgi:hypothetical protein